MKERPILFSAPMVRALLAGTKTQTRRVLKLHPSAMACCCGSTGGRWKVSDGPQWHCGNCGGGMRLTSKDAEGTRCPYGVTGDRLWVRETFSDVYGEGGDEQRRRECVMYRADGDTDPYVIGGAWTPSIHMPRWASRLVLEITDVRVERLQAISRGDAMAEGCPFPNMADSDDPRAWFANLWRDINGPASWDANPWVWVVEFKRVETAR